MCNGEHACEPWPWQLSAPWHVISSSQVFTSAFSPHLWNSSGLTIQKLCSKTSELIWCLALSPNSQCVKGQAGQLTSQEMPSKSGKWLSGQKYSLASMLLFFVVSWSCSTASATHHTVAQKSVSMFEHFYVIASLWVYPQEYDNTYGYVWKLYIQAWIWDIYHVKWMTLSWDMWILLWWLFETILWVQTPEL